MSVQINMKQVSYVLYILYICASTQYFGTYHICATGADPGFLKSGFFADLSSIS